MVGQFLSFIEKELRSFLKKEKFDFKNINIDNVHVYYDKHITVEGKIEFISGKKVFPVDFEFQVYTNERYAELKVESFKQEITRNFDE